MTQIREVTSALMSVAKQQSLTTVLVGHVTKDGSIAGPRALEHLVDVVLHFEGDRHAQLRMVRALKNRFGPTDEVGCFELGEYGLIGLPDPSGLFVSQRAKPVPGTCVTVTLEGRRPLLAEVQTLVAPSTLEIPRRVTSGPGLRPGRHGAGRASAPRRRQDRQARRVRGDGRRGPADRAFGGPRGRAGPGQRRRRPERPRLGGGHRRGRPGGRGAAGAGVARRLAEAERMGFRRAIVPAGSAGIPGRRQRTAGGAPAWGR